MADIISSKTLLIALLGGILPAVFWLWFWLKEDKKNPEPRGLIIFVFLAGMVAVPIVFGLEKLANLYIPTGIFLIIVWSAIEEILKYLAALVTALKSRFMDEPVDAMIYMITAALGFAALENSLFLIIPLEDGQFLNGLMSNNLRFIGATVLHIVSSATIGAFIGLSFYRTGWIKKIYWSMGVFLAIALHSAFNFFIIKDSGRDTFTVFGLLWVITVLILLLFEKVKRIKP